MRDLELSRPSARYLSHVEGLRSMLFGRFSRRNVRGQNRNGGRLAEADIAQIRISGASAIAEMLEKYHKG